MRTGKPRNFREHLAETRAGKVQPLKAGIELRSDLQTGHRKGFSNRY
jgi:hypothetical protein